MTSSVDNSELSFRENLFTLFIITLNILENFLIALAVSRKLGSNIMTKFNFLAPWLHMAFYGLKVVFLFIFAALINDLSISLAYLGFKRYAL